MYHRITPPTETIQAGMYVTPETFEQHLQLLAKYFKVISLTEFHSYLGNKQENSSDKPLCVITFDDGWKDFHDSAYPLLEKYNFPATVFLPTNFIDSDIKFWTDDFAHLLVNRRATSFKQTVDDNKLDIIDYLDKLSGSFDTQLEAGLAYLKKFSAAEIKEILLVLSDVWQVDPGNVERDFLNWREISEMRESGLVAFGSHTVNHQILTTVEEEVVRSELDDSRKTLLERNMFDDSCISFCYPNGNYTREIADLVGASGYDLAVTTQKGWNHVTADKFTLKRIGIHEDISSTDALFACRIAELI